MTTRRRLRQQSSAASLLRGFSYRGKTIAGVFRQPGTTRVLHFTDGTRQTTTRDTVHKLAQLKGLLDYRAKYQRSSRAGKRRMLTKSTRRQHAIFTNYLHRTTAQHAALPASLRGAAVRKLRTLRASAFGSPLIGKRPASSLSGGLGVFAVAKDAGVRFVTIGKGARRRVVPVRS